MPFRHFCGVMAYTFENLSQAGVVHGLFSRLGGVSPEPWASLNLGGTVGDARANVVENRRRIFEAFERPVESVFDVWQVHGTHWIATDRPRPLDAPHEPADIILTNQSAITLFMRFADCVPILLFDPRQNAAALVHAGWKGTLSRASAVAVNALQDKYGSRPGDILAGIGPSICRSCYEVGDEVVHRAEAAFDGQVGRILSKPVGSRYHLDLWEANRLALIEAGVKPGSIQTAELCTAEDTQMWYSHRAENGKTGRFGVLMALGSS